LQAAEACSATVVGRVALGHSYVALEPSAVPELLTGLPPRAVYTVLDAPAGTPTGISRWGPVPPDSALQLMRRVKSRFDPSGVCNPGALVGGI
jgi:glycolate oxidase FAD binding subunit